MMVELFGDLGPEHRLSEEFGVISGDELRQLERIVARAERRGLDLLPARDRERLLTLAFRLVAAGDRLGLLDPELRQRIVAARHIFGAELPDDLREAVEFFDPERYNAAARVEQNILFGSVIAGEAEARERVESAIGEVLDELGLREIVLIAGLDYAVGTGGSRLSPAQRQKAAIARAVLKRPSVLALDEAMAVLDPAAENRILASLRSEFAGRSIIAALSRPEAARCFGRLLLMEHGRLIDETDAAAIARAEPDRAARLAAE